MIFRPELAAKVMDGSKTVTRRLCSSNPRSPWWRERCALNVGSVYAVQPGRGKVAIGSALVVSVAREWLGSIENAGVRLREPLREGFASLEEFAAAWVAINGSWDPLAEVWRVEFERV